MTSTTVASAAYPAGISDQAGRLTLVSTDPTPSSSTGQPGLSSVLPRASMQQVIMALRAAVITGDAIVMLAERARESGMTPDVHVVTASAATFAGQLYAANAALGSLGSHALLPSIADVDLARIKRACAALFQLGRATDALQRETNLEHVFDEEHELRQRLADPDGTDNRAFSYYDTATPPSPHVGATPDPAALTTSVETGGLSPASDRDGILAALACTPEMLHSALDNACTTATAIIQEPAPPAEPSVMDVLLKTAGLFLLTAAGGFLEEGLGAAFALADSAIGMSARTAARVGEEAAETFGKLAQRALAESLKEGTKELVDVGLKAADAGESEAGKGRRQDRHLSPMTLYFMQARNVASQEKARLARAFAQLNSTFRRLPTPTLVVVRNGINDVAARLLAAFERSVLIGWVNFIAELDAHTSSASQQIAHGIEAKGVLRVHVKVPVARLSEADMNLTELGVAVARGMSVRGIEQPVLDQFPKDRLGNIPIRRTVRVNINDGRLPDVEFDVTDDGTIALPKMTPFQKALLARYAHARLDPTLGATDKQARDGAALLFADVRDATLLDLETSHEM
ncbi:MAG TPA: hypothetical protein VGM88_29660 [Kofleriaceae bacterium]|jgi:hypothetical protein